MARAWDIDEVHEGGGGHLSASAIPTAFILAQYARTKISGKTLIVAVATDLHGRWGVECAPATGTRGQGRRPCRETSGVSLKDLTAD